MTGSGITHGVAGGREVALLDDSAEKVGSLLAVISSLMRLQSAGAVTLLTVMASRCVVGDKHPMDCTSDKQFL